MNASRASLAAQLTVGEINRWYEVTREDDAARAPTGFDLPPRGRRAETALLASIAAGETPLNELHPAAIATIVQALRHVGEDFSARLFAMETAIAYGL